MIKHVGKSESCMVSTLPIILLPGNTAAEGDARAAAACWIRYLPVQYNGIRQRGEQTYGHGEDARIYMVRECGYEAGMIKGVR